MAPSIESLAEEWLTHDRNPVTRNEIDFLLTVADIPQLEVLLRPRLTFGTAGLRAAMGAGNCRMNSLTVLQATQGLCSYLLESNTNAATNGVVVGCDARHHSEEFLLRTAIVFLAQGVKVYLLGRCHTPLVPFVVGQRRAAAGIMITASHNPKDDNGYKVYWGNGCQIVPPTDQRIAEAIERERIPWPESWLGEDALWRGMEAGEVEDLKESGVPGKTIRRSYRDSVVKATGWQSGSASDLPGFTYTPMHGVGLDVFMDVIQSIGAGKSAHVVTSQAQPDPDFPTVQFPNPEEKGALDEAIRTAAANGDRFILANDPDADRFAAAEVVNGKWRQFTGNQLGVLLASYALERARANGAREPGPRGFAMLASAVSSRMLAHMARQTGQFHFEETLTGFKWLGNRAQELKNAGYTALFAYEEAIGFMLTDVVYDKDGVTAAALFLAALKHWAAAGLTPWTKLQQLYAEFGHFEEANTYLRSSSPEVTKKVFQTIRARAPKKVGRRRITRWRDLTEGFDTATPDNKPVLPVDKSAQMITCELEGDVVFTVRGSGTEPKIKLYIEGRASTAAAAHDAAEEVLQDLLAEWFKPAENSLKLA